MVKRIVQVLQGRSDDPRSTRGTGSDFELSRFEVLSNGRRNRRLWSLSGVDVVGGRGGEPESVRGSGSCEGDEGEKGRKMRRSGLYAQLEKSSISLFKMIPSGVMTAEPQYVLIAMCRSSTFDADSSTIRGEWLTRGERDDVTPPIGSCQIRGAMIVQGDVVGRIVLCGLKLIPESPETSKERHTKGAG